VCEHAGGALVVAGGGAERALACVVDRIGAGLAGGACGRSKKPAKVTASNKDQTTIQLRRRIFNHSFTSALPFVGPFTITSTRNQSLLSTKHQVNLRPRCAQLIPTGSMSLLPKLPLGLQIHPFLAFHNFFWRVFIVRLNSNGEIREQCGKPLGSTRAYRQWGLIAKRH